MNAHLLSASALLPWAVPAFACVTVTTPLPNTTISSKTWDCTANQGTPQQPRDAWLHSTAPCNVQTWALNTWNHVQISYSRDSAGNVTYKSVWFDNVEQDLDVTVPSAFALGWGPVLLANFQVDSMTFTQATSVVYVDKLTIYRW